MLKRFSVSLEENLLAEFDRFIALRTYSNRSEAVRDLIRKAFVKDTWELDKEVAGVITLVYDHHRYQLQEKITELQHELHHHIISSMHVHMDHDNCLEVIVVRGKASKVQSLAEQLSALRGVKDGHLSMSSTGNHLP